MFLHLRENEIKQIKEYQIEELTNLFHSSIENDIVITEKIYRSKNCQIL